MRRGVVFALLAVFAGFVAPGGEVGGRAEASTAPNFVLILTDDQRWDTIGRCLGQFDGTVLAAGAEACMPFVQQDLIANGVTFLQGHVTTAVCCPSRASILKGQYSFHTGVVDNNGLPFFDDTSTLATWLDAGGYRTGMFGKYLNGWDSGFAPVSRIPPGWDSWHVFYDAEEYRSFSLQEAEVGGTPVLNAYTDKASTSRDACAVGNFYSTDLLCAKALEFLAADETTPFFLFFSPPAPHLPATPPIRWEDAFSSVTLPMYPSYNQAPSPDPPKWIPPAPLDDLALGKIAGQFRLILAANRAVDDAVQALYQELAADGRLANTVFVYISDNGYARAEHRYDSKGCEFDECHRVPLVVVCPPAVCPDATPGRVDADHFALNIDLAPTFAELAGVAPPIAVDGTSLVSVLNDPAVPWRDHFLIDDDWPAVGTLRGVVSAQGDGHVYKYVEFAAGQAVELYDLTMDPGELSNLASDASHAEVRSALAALLAEEGGTDPAQPDPPVLTSVPPNPSGSSVAFSFQGPGGLTFTCSLDGAPPAACSSPKSYSGLTTGAHTFSVRAVDLQGNTSIPATYYWSVSGGGLYTLTVTRAGAGRGVVKSVPVGIACGRTCAASFATGTSVVLTAKSKSGSKFQGWSGGCSGTALTCTLSMTADRAVTATFVPS